MMCSSCVRGIAKSLLLDHFLLQDLREYCPTRLKYNGGGFDGGGEPNQIPKMHTAKQPQPIND